MRRSVRGVRPRVASVSIHEDKGPDVPEAREVVLQLQLQVRLFACDTLLQFAVDGPHRS